MRKYLRCFSDNGRSDLTVGKRYEIVDIDDFMGADCYVIIDDASDRSYWPIEADYEGESYRDWFTLETDEDTASISGVTVLPDETIGGVLREYREVKRKARAGEWIKIVNNGTGHGLPIGHVCKAKNADCADGWLLSNVEDTEVPDYVVLEPTDIIRVGDERLRMVDRKAAVGERVIIIDAEGIECGCKNGEIYDVKGYDGGDDPVIWPGGTEDSEIYLEREEYRVLEPVRVVGQDYAEFIAKASEIPELSSRPATDQIAENIATLTAKVQALEAAVKRMNTQLRVAHKDLDRIPCDPQQIRDEIVERAKADVKALEQRYEDGCHWIKYVVNRDKRTVVALGKDPEGWVWARGIAKCAPGDVFNAHIGRVIALRRALGIEVPAEYLSVPAPTEVRVGDVVRGNYLSIHQHITGPVSEVFPDSGDVAFRNAEWEAQRGYSRCYASCGSFEIVDDTREEADAPVSSAQKGAAA